MEYLVAAFLLALFPFSMLFMQLFRRLPQPWMQALALVLWPQLGIGLLSWAEDPPEWLIIWGLLSALLYAFRALALRELSLWIGFIALSTWGLLPLLTPALTTPAAGVQLLGFSLPLAMLVMLGVELQQRYGAAFAGLPGGLAQPLPRFSALFAVTILAALATPLFPAFFTLLAGLMQSSAAMPLYSLWLLAIWLLWSWSGARITQGFLIGPHRACTSPDLTLARTWLYAAGLVALTGAGLVFAGGWL
jgi:NADH:ubiquinone oxidoreductase subunit 4 (subunit M)